MVEASRLNELVQNIIAFIKFDFWTNNDWTNNQSDKKEEENEVEDTVTNNASFPQLRLLDRVDWWANLTTAFISKCIFVKSHDNRDVPWSKPEEHNRVKLVNVWNQENR